MEVAATVAAHDFELTVDGFGDVGGGQRTADGFGVIEESQVMLALFAQLGDEVGKAVAELFELLVGDLQVPGRFDGAPALLKLGGIGFVAMGFGIALHMHGAELNVVVGKGLWVMGRSPPLHTC